MHLGIKNNIKYILILLLIFVLITVFVMFIPNSRTYDYTLLHFIQGLLTQYPMFFAQQVSDFGKWGYLFWPQLTAVSVLFSHKKYAEGILLVVFTQVAWHGLDFIKEIVKRERPCENCIAGYSFPSGHATTTGCFYGILLYLTLTYVHNKFWRYFLISFLCIFMFLVAISRWKLNVHFPTDVIAGFIVGYILVNLYIILLKLIKK